MLDAELSRTAPLQVAPGACEPVTVRPLALTGRLSFRAKAKALGNRQEVAGFSVAGQINSLRANGDRMSVRLGPDEWLLVCPESDLGAVIEAVATAMDEAFFSLVDVSHRNVGFTLEGADAAAAVNSGCPLDLHLSAFPVGMATRTILGKAEIVLARTADTAWRVECWRSFGAYVHAFLVDAARDFLPQ
ncbi:sarcosine oxidase subunit gamma [Consotaella aegiceratis]|uniref:sarcosine oxidase subunit gamma n=1 Tax=Consotaella aegiceratis TaxID=3097961 RepID=UPI002F427498